ncbi:MAG: hypothetical protein IT385_20555 [Deltaproteobacteria bacterium]|nr:hypothetical protein [Deltaproteobacteria bacterium]
MTPDPVAEFLSGLPANSENLSYAYPLKLEVDAMAGHRVADVALLLGLIAAFWGLGRFLKSAGLPNLRPFVLASALTGVLLLFFTNSAFWMVAGVTLEPDKVSVQKHLGADEVFAWSDLKRVELDSGDLYPAFTDDTSLVLVGPDDKRLAIPRFVPGIAAIAPEVRKHLPPAPPATP